MPSLPPVMWAELYLSNAWSDVTTDLRETSNVTVTRGMSSESVVGASAEPTAGQCDLDQRNDRWSPRDPNSVLYDHGRNTPMRFGYTMGPPWVATSGIDNNLVSAPSSTGFNVTDIDVRLDLSLENWAFGQNLAARYSTSGNNRSWMIGLADTGQLSFIWSIDGSSANRIVQLSDLTSGGVIKAYNGQRIAIRVTLDVNNGASGYELRFYTGRTVNDADNEWNLLGKPIIGGATTTIFNPTAPIELGDSTGIAEDSSSGKVFGFLLKSSIGSAGTTVASMQSSDGVAGATSFVSGGSTWTVSGGATLSNKHIRLSGEVPEWPTTRDQSGNNRYVSVAPTGITRRMDAGSAPQTSSLLRYINSKTPVECWPLTDGPTSPRFKSIVGGEDLRQNVLIGTDTAVVKSAGSLADWIEPVLSAKANTTAGLRAGVRRTTGTDAAWSFDIFLSGGGPLGVATFNFDDRGAGTDADNRVEIQLILTGSLNRVSVIRNSYATDTDSAALLANIDNVLIFDDDPHHLRLSITPGTNTAWAVYADGVSIGSGTISGIAVKSLRSVDLGWGFATGNGMTDRAFGYFTYWDGSGPTAAQIYSAYTGFQGELAGTRIERLSTEGGYVASTAGETLFQRPLGIQGKKTLLDLLNESSATNFGYLLDARDRGEVIHRGQSTLWNQHPAFTIDFSNGILQSYKYRDDDLLTENDITITREYGGTGRQISTTGSMSVNPYPVGVGRYDKQYTYCLYQDSDTNQTAFMRLHLGTYNGVRYTQLVLDLANKRVFEMFPDIMRADCGDIIKITNVPTEHGPDDVYCLINGYQEEAGPNVWRITFNCAPGGPWHSALTIGVDGRNRIDTAGCQLSADCTSTATSISILTTAISRWVDSATYASDFPFDIRVGGEIMRVTALTGTTLSQTMTVTRSVNGIVKSHSSGDDVRLAFPTYIPM